MTDNPIRPAAYVNAGDGTLKCSCGFDVPAQDLTQPVVCPRCGRTWEVQLEITPNRNGTADGN